MKRAISSMQRGSSITSTRTPRSRRKVLVAAEIPVLGDHDMGNAELHDRARAHHAGAERGVEGGIPDNCGAAAGIAQAIHLAMRDRVALLDAPVIALAEDSPVADQNRSDRQAALGRPRSASSKQRVTKGAWPKARSSARGYPPSDRPGRARRKLPRLRYLPQPAPDLADRSCWDRRRRRPPSRE